MQILINISGTFSIVLLLSLSFQILYTTNKFYDLALAGIITLSPYITMSFLNLHVNFIVSCLFSVLVSSFSYLLIFQFIYKKLLLKRTSGLVLLIVSLGIFIIVQNIISIIYGSETKSFDIAFSLKTINISSSIISYGQLSLLIMAILILIFYFLYFRYNRNGVLIRAIASNSELLSIFGVNLNRIRVISIIIASVISAIAAILYSVEYNFNPSFGFNILLYGIIAMIIGGLGSIRGIIGGSFLLASAQHLGAFVFDSKWMDTIAFVILILFLMWKPLGFSGNRLKKVEI